MASLYGFYMIDFLNNGIANFVILTFSFDETVSDVAGEVVEVGPGVNKFKVGDKVVAMLTCEMQTL
ncbi:hypothetical protein ACLOJK_022533, partial [Asimina triloba]